MACQVEFTIGVVCITDKVREARLRWYGHKRREGDDCVKRILEANVGGQQSRGRQRKDMDRRRQAQHGGLAAQRGGCQGSSWMEKENPCGWPLTWGIHSLKERQRAARIFAKAYLYITSSKMCIYSPLENNIQLLYNTSWLVRFLLILVTRVWIPGLPFPGRPGIPVIFRSRIPGIENG